MFIVCKYNSRVEMEYSLYSECLIELLTRLNIQRTSTRDSLFYYNVNKISEKAHNVSFNPYKFYHPKIEYEVET